MELGWEPGVRDWALAATFFVIGLSTGFNLASDPEWFKRVGGAVVVAGLIGAIVAWWRWLRLPLDSLTDEELAALERAPSVTPGDPVSTGQISSDLRSLWTRFRHAMRSPP